MKGCEKSETHNGVFVENIAVRVLNDLARLGTGPKVIKINGRTIIKRTDDGEVRPAIFGALDLGAYLDRYLSACLDYSDNLADDVDELVERFNAAAEEYEIYGKTYLLIPCRTWHPI